MSQIFVFNTLTGQKELFQPLSPPRVNMYACGPTVYDASHLGHARMAIVWDVVQRYLRFRGYEVIYVRNITDVDDKIINRAKELETTPERVAREFTYRFWRDMHELNVEPPDFEPRCTEFIQPMHDFIAGLIERQAAYAIDGDVYFDVSSFQSYGKLSGKKLEDLLVGAREQVIQQDDLKSKKRSPADFALWKGVEQSEPGWNSPWGYGRPGWHLECSSMIKEVLGETIDIHAGGEDLIFPHHENEIAQSSALHDKPLAKYWLHNSFVQVSSEKMSKSLGNFSTIGNLLESFSADTIRLFVLQTHYRHPIDFSLEALTGARTAMNRLLRAAAYADTGTSSDTTSNGGGAERISRVQDRSLLRIIHDNDATEAFEAAFLEAMDNDFNTAKAVSQLFSLSDQIFQSKDDESKRRMARVLKRHGKLLGLSFEDRRKAIDTTSGAGIMNLVLELRQQARSKKDWETADRIRQALSALGIQVMDEASGAVWEKS